MIVTANQVYGTRIICDGVALGRLDDLLFDDRTWRVTHISVGFGHWLNRRQVLVTPKDIEAADWPTGRVHLGLTESQLKAAPSLDSHPPVAVQKLQEFQRFLAWDAYWTGLFNRIPNDGDIHLRNTRAVKGHHVICLDDAVGHVDNFVIDDATWLIRYLVVHIGKHRNVKRVMVEPRWVDSIIWEERGVHIHLPKKAVEHCGELISNSKCFQAM